MSRISLVILALLIGCQQDMPTPATALSDVDIAKIEKEVNLLRETVRDSVLAGNLGFYIDLIASDDFSILGNGNATWSKSDFVEMTKKYKEAAASGKIKESVTEIRNETFVLSPNSVLTVGHWTSTVKDEEGIILAEDISTTGTILWVKDEGEWRVQHAHQSQPPPAPPNNN